MKSVLSLIAFLIATSFVSAQSLEPKWEEKVTKHTLTEKVTSYFYQTKDREFYVDVVSEVVQNKRLISEKFGTKILITINDLVSNDTHEVRIEQGKWESVLREYVRDEARVCKNIWSKYLGEFNAIMHDLPKKVSSIIKKTSPNTSGKREDCAIFKTR